MKKLVYLAAIAAAAIVAACGGKDDSETDVTISMDFFLKIRDYTLYNIGDKDVYIFAYQDRKSMVDGANLKDFAFKNYKYTTTFYLCDTATNAQIDSTGLVRITSNAINDTLRCGYMRINYSSGYTIAEELPTPFFCGDTTFVEIKVAEKPNGTFYYQLLFNESEW